ncbi:DNA polymerase alpha catalytic subunit, partial [Trichinella spiralis]|uniref:DNA polymerase alpha catalytic subunit n=1 Tax=Trichinella spiralis TaxID=6334 RepID=UPI0001EFE76E
MNRPDVRSSGQYVYLPRRGQRSGSKNSRRWRSPSRTSSGSVAPLTLYVATARSKCTNTRAERAGMVDSGTNFH